MTRISKLPKRQAEVVFTEESIDWLIGDTKSCVGLENWDYMEASAPEVLTKSTVATGSLDEDFARILSKEQIVNAMTAAWAHRHKHSTRAHLCE